MTENSPHEAEAPETKPETATGTEADAASAAAVDPAPSDAPGEGNPLAARIAELEAERDSLKDQILRALADAENVRKRANRQISEERVYAIERFARDLLNVSDNMARALGALPDDAREALSESGRTLLEGVELTQKELHAALARHGVSAIDASPGAEFDPNQHQAVAQIPSPQPSGKVAETYQSGWKIGDRTLRAAMVAVSAGSPAGADAAGQESE